LRQSESRTPLIVVCRRCSSAPCTATSLLTFPLSFSLALRAIRRTMLVPEVPLVRTLRSGFLSKVGPPVFFRGLVTTTGLRANPRVAICRRGSMRGVSGGQSPGARGPLSNCSIPPGSEVSDSLVESTRSHSLATGGLSPHLVPWISRALDVGAIVLRSHAMIAACLRTCRRAVPVSPFMEAPRAAASLSTSCSPLWPASLGSLPGGLAVVPGVQLARSWTRSTAS
jgi:hypothetical protein